MMKVDVEKCIGCEKCIKECFASDIEIADGIAHIKNKMCFKCGHCIAVCPTHAVSTDALDMNEVVEFSKEEFNIESDNLLNFIKFRRTIRQFENKVVENEKILKIIEAGRFTQTGSNMQDPSYVVVKEDIGELKSLTFKSLNKIGQTMLETVSPETKRYRRYAQMWVDMYEAFKEDPEKNDKLFFNAPVVIVVTADSIVNGALASSNMELMTNALGLGTFFSGFFVRAANENNAIRDLLEIKEGKEIVTCMVIGYPKVKYERTVPRNKPNIIWK